MAQGVQAAHHGEVGAGLGCESVSAGTVDPKQSADISCVNLIHVLKHHNQTEEAVWLNSLH